MSLLLSIVPACTAPPPAREPVFASADRLAIAPTAIEVLLKEHPCPADRDVLALPLGDTEHQSIFLMQLRKREPRHVHVLHDLTVFIVKGTGAIMIRDGDEDRHFSAEPGGVFHIPRGVVHYAVANPPNPLVGVAVFSPRYDGRDNVPVKE